MAGPLSVEWAKAHAVTKAGMRLVRGSPSPRRRWPERGEAGPEAGRHTHAAPNKGLELTASSVRSYLAPASGSSSGLAFGAKGAEEAKRKYRVICLAWLHSNAHRQEGDI